MSEGFNNHHVVSNHNGTYRYVLQREDEIKVVNGCLFGVPINMLGEYLSIGYSPTQLKRIVSRYKQYSHLFGDD